MRARTVPADRRDDDTSGNDPSREDEGRWADWPCCPGCGRRRRTRCPTCDLGSDEFSLAEFFPAAESLPVPGPDARSGQPSLKKDDGVLLMCPSCDEAFSPQFYRLCEQ
ncbi:MAG: hypothetical protein JJ992_18665, partial [Planctomycetes bacterium]|nr:hypothetical protein [Planctomycetota bacterium]